MKKLRLQFRFANYGNVFKVNPTIQIVWSKYEFDGFAIELGWLLWGVGVRFYATK